MNAPMGPADEEDAASRRLTKVCRGIDAASSSWPAAST